MQRFMFVFVLSLVFGLYCNVSVYSADATPGNLVLLPFETKDAGKYAALKDGLRAMLAGRLAAKDDISVIDASLPASEKALLKKSYPNETQSTFTKLSADNIGMGEISLTEAGLRVAITVYTRDGSTAQEIAVVAASDALILNAMEDLADDIAVKVFGHKPQDSVSAVDQSTSSGTDAFQTAHPDRKYKEEIISGVTVFDGEEFSSIAKEDLVRRRSSLSDGVVALSTANVDGIDKEEIVVASERNVKIFQYERGLLQKLSEYTFPKETKAHALNLADLDEDGLPEIYISATRDDRFSSMILTWSREQGFIEKQIDIRWAIRPVVTPEEGLVLLGQRKSNEVESFFEPQIFILKIDDNANRVTRGKKMFLPPQLNLFDFIYADIDGDGIMEKVGITSTLKLAVFDRENRLNWISQENYGGSVKYLGERWRTEFGDNFGNITADDENYMELQYVPPRLVAEDVNGDGKTDIIGVKNILSTFEMLTNFRSFSTGNVVCLSWNGVEMKEIWQTDTLDGYISDIDFVINSDQLADSLGSSESVQDSRVRLFVGQVPSGGFTEIFNFLGDKANLYVYEFKILGNPQDLKDEG